MYEKFFLIISNYSLISAEKRQQKFPFFLNYFLERRSKKRLEIPKVRNDEILTISYSN